MAKAKTVPESNVVDINLSDIRKKRFRVDGDNNRILELNTSDLGMLARLKSGYPRLIEMAQSSFGKLPDIDSDKEDYDFLTDESTGQLINTLKTADEEMRKLIDYIFDSNVSEVCAPYGSMYDPINGSFRFEHILNTLANLYETDVSAEMGKITNRVKKHTDKYIK